MESSGVVLIVATLAVYRMSVMIAQEEGPFGVFAALRERIDPQQATWIGRGVRCVACVSFWLAGLAALLIHASVLDGTAPGFWWGWLGMAGGVLVIHRAVKS